MKFCYYFALLLYYSIANKIPNKFGGLILRKKLVKHIIISCGKNVHIAENVYFGMGKNLILHDNARIGKGSKILGNGIVEIGSYNVMGPEVMMITGDHKMSFDSDKTTNTSISEGIVIGDECYIGARVTILKGVKIGERSVVGACSLVNNCLLYTSPSPRD